MSRTNHVGRYRRFERVELISDRFFPIMGGRVEGLISLADAARQWKPPIPYVPKNPRYLNDDLDIPAEIAAEIDLES